MKIANILIALFPVLGHTILNQESEIVTCHERSLQYPVGCLKQNGVPDHCGRFIFENWISSQAVTTGFQE